MNGCLTKSLTGEAAAAIVQIGARTNDPERDIPEEARAKIIAALESSGTSSEEIAPLRDVVTPKALDFNRTFGEALPEGLRLGMG